MRCRPFVEKGDLGIKLEQTGDGPAGGEVNVINSKYTQTRFGFAYAWWSAHNAAKYCEKDKEIANGMEFIDQDKAYDACGEKVKENLLDGSAVVMFAYGLSGSGKTFTITGRPDSIVKFGSGDATDGLVIRAVESLYNKVCDSLPLSSNGLNRIGRMRVSAGCNAPHVPTGVQSTAAHQPPSCCRCGRSSAMAYSSKSVPRAWRSTTSRSIPSPRAPQRSCATLPAPRLVTRLRRSRQGHRPPPLLARLRRPHQPPRQV